MSLKSSSRIVLLLFLSIFCSCKTNYDDSNLRAHFTQEEIKDLHKIVDFFKIEVCNTPNTDIKECFQEISADHEAGIYFLEQIDFEKQKTLYNSISKSTFNKIWGYCKSTSDRGATYMEYLCPRHDSKYQKYLQSVGKNYPFINQYVKNLRETGAFSSLEFTLDQIAYGKIDMDLKDPDIQLIIAIHFLSLHDEYSRNDDYNELRRSKPKLIINNTQKN